MKKSFVRRHHSVSLRSSLTAMALLGLGSSLLRAQCTQFFPLGTATVSARAFVRFDPDGNGPEPELLVFGGSFANVGTATSPRVAGFEPISRTWRSFGAGFDGDVYSLTVWNGELIAGGTFNYSGSTLCRKLARWDGTAWTEFGSPSGSVWALFVRTNGSLAVGGDFTDIGGLPVRYVGLLANLNAPWTGIGPASSINGTVRAISEQANNLVIGGYFTTQIGGVADGLAQQNGTNWVPLLPTGGSPRPNCQALLRLPSGDVVAAVNTSSTSSVLKQWNGTSMTDIGFGTGTMASLAATTAGFVVGGNFSTFAPANGLPFQANGVAALSGTAFSSLGAGRPETNAVAAIGNEVFASSTLGAARFDGTTWTALGGGVDAPGSVQAMVRLTNGDLVAAGDFSRIGGVVATDVARRVGNTWTPMGSVVGYVRAVVELPSGEVVIGGRFDLPTGRNIARWTGTAWAPFGSGLGTQFQEVKTLAVLPNGELVAGGSFTHTGNVMIGNVARWSANAWSGFNGGTSWNGTPANATVWALGVTAGGELLVGGSFTHAGSNGTMVAANNIARWTGSSWQPLGSGTAGVVRALVRDTNGEMVVGGSFTSAGGLGAARVARWNGAWSPMGALTSGTVNCLALLPNGRVTAGGAFTVNNGGNELLAQWNGLSWEAIPSGPSNGAVLAIAAIDASEAMAAGDFSFAAGQTAGSMARFFTGCPASVSVTGSGCDGNTLVALDRPVLGTVFRSQASGLPVGFVFAVYGVSALPALPLNTIAGMQTLGQPGCVVLVGPDASLFFPTVGGTAIASLALNANPAAIGLILEHQVFSFEAPANTVIAVRTTNALQLTLGLF